MKTLRIELDRGRGWEVRATGAIPADTSTTRIEADLRAYAIQYPHRALVDGVEVARVRGASRAGRYMRPRRESAMRVLFRLMLVLLGVLAALAVVEAERRAAMSGTTPTSERKQRTKWDLLLTTRIVAVAWRFLAASCVALSCCAQTTTAFDGVYQGAGQLNDVGLRCDPTIQLDPLTVTGGHAQLGRGTGSVRPNGQLHMTYEGEGIVVTGQFQGNQFRGTAWNRQGSPCIYRVEMNRVS
jgi:hypothetical protein